MADPRKNGRSVFVAGNWKMYKTPDEAIALAGELARKAPLGDRLLVGIFPPAISLSAVAAAVRAAPREIIVGAQNMYHEREGAFTGEISAPMILAAGGKAVLLGHSERRHVFGENDDLIAKKVAQALASGLLPVLCVGEKLDEREAGATEAVVARQLAAGLSAVKAPEALARVVVAYEPVWAIGTGKTATPRQGQEVHSFLRAELGKAFRALGAPADGAGKTLILYGGSVKPENAGELLSELDIDGLLVGGASLKADSFLQICKAGA